MAAVAAAAGGLGPWPGRAPGAKPGRAEPRRGHPGNGPLRGLRGTLAYGPRRSGQGKGAIQAGGSGTEAAARAWRCRGMQAGRTRGNLDGPVQEDPRHWRARSRTTPGGGPGREGASGGSSGAQLSGGLPRGRLGSGAPGARAVRGPSRDLPSPLTYSLLVSPAPALPLWARGAGPASCLSAPWPRPQPRAAHSQTARRAGSASGALCWSSVGGASVRPTFGVSEAWSGRGQEKDELDWAELYCQSD